MVQHSLKQWHKIFFVSFFVLAGLMQLWKLYWPKETIELKGQELRVLVAHNTYHHRKGLSDREQLAPYGGMLFIFSFPYRQAMVMRDMEFPLDIVWAREGMVVDIAKNLQPDDGPEAQLTRYLPRTEADMVLELSAGWSDTYGLKIGDSLKIVKP